MHWWWPRHCIDTHCQTDTKSPLFLLSFTLYSTLLYFMSQIICTVKACNQDKSQFQLTIFMHSFHACTVTITTITANIATPTTSTVTATAVYMMPWFYMFNLHSYICLKYKPCQIHLSSVTVYHSLSDSECVIYFALYTLLLCHKDSVNRVKGSTTATAARMSHISHHTHFQSIDERQSEWT